MSNVLRFPKKFVPAPPPKKRWKRGRGWRTYDFESNKLPRPVPGETPLLLHMQCAYTGRSRFVLAVWDEDIELGGFYRQPNGLPISEGDYVISDWYQAPDPWLEVHTDGGKFGEGGTDG